MTFYLKYRPQKIKDLDIDSVRETLIQISKSKDISHSFLFAGPKGTGKTSTARILAKIINCEQPTADKEPCNKCNSCFTITNGTSMDVIEMDAASNRGIDDMRALRDVAKLAPANSRAKIYIIDEAHMLTNEASNALLKILEEPPKHVYFILATTNPEKLIDTIKSRTTIINFTKATFEETMRSLQRIIKNEKISKAWPSGLKIDEKNIEKIIKMAKGSFRDAVKLLEQYIIDSKFLENQSIFDAETLADTMLSKDADKALTIIKDALINGVSVDSITTELLTILQTKLLEDKSEDLIKLIGLILSAQEYNKVTPIEELPLELAVIKYSKLG